MNSFWGRSELLDEVHRRLRADDIRFLSLQFTDIVGLVKSVTIPAEQLPEVVERGHWFDGSAIEGFARVAEADMYLVPDLSTYAVIPWMRGEMATARLICWVFTPSGEPFPGDPRYVLLRAVKAARELGFEYRTAPEVEFFLFRRDESGQIAPLPHDQASYFDFTTDLAIQVRQEMVGTLQLMGVRVEASHHELAAGQHELDLAMTEAIASADQTVTLRYALKAVAQARNLHVTFMPKPIQGTYGSGMHIHQGLFDVETGRNVFADPDDEYGLSEVGRYFVAGQLYHARAITAVTSPLVNSYKRLASGFEAPAHISWARINSAALIRVPKLAPDQVGRTRVEIRSPDPACNPYLAFAVLLWAGLDGIRRRLPLPEPVEENLYQMDATELRRRNIGLLPMSLAEALDALEQDPVIIEALGPPVFERFLEAKRLEWVSYRDQVTPWELSRYLEAY